jgi:ABC-type multidrug transport system ATPase subunit
VHDKPTPALQCSSLAVELPSGRRLLSAIDVTLDEGSLLAIVGPTGSGKTTLLRALAGDIWPSAGTVHVHGHDILRADRVRSAVGYVPQEDVLHVELPLRVALRYGAALRFPPDVSDRELDAHVDAVLDELGLTRCADTVIRRLSGGERKRTSVAMELLTAPSIVLLDEPTTGLDPSYEKSIMQLLRRLADAGRTVVVVTHSVQSLHLCDQVLFLASGGRASFLGTHDAALAHFQRQDVADVFADLEAGTAPLQPVPAPDATRPAPDTTTPAPQIAAASPRVPWRVWRHQVVTLVHRQSAVVLADRRIAAYLIAAAVIPGLLALALTDAGAWAPDTMPQTGARRLLAALVVAATAIGVANTVREVVKDQAVRRHERAAGVSPTAYLASKVIVFGEVTVLQAVILVVVATARAGGPPDGSALAPRFEILIAVALVALAAAALGLLLSSLVSSSEQAMALIPIVFVVQWLLSGVAVNLQGVPGLQQISHAASANWGVAAIASTVDLQSIDLDALMHGCDDEDVADNSCDRRWGHAAPVWFGNIVGLLVTVVVPVWGAARMIERRDRVPHHLDGARRSSRPTSITSETYVVGLAATELLLLPTVPWDVFGVPAFAILRAPGSITWQGWVVYLLTTMVVAAVPARRLAARPAPASGWGHAIVAATIAVPALLLLKLTQTPASLASPWAYVLIVIAAGMAYGSATIAMEPGTSPDDDPAPPRTSR